VTLTSPHALQLRYDESRDQITLGLLYDGARADHDLASDVLSRTMEAIELLVGSPGHST
jgi:hypothetical protein